MTEEEFEMLVAQSLDSLPETYRKLMDNVDVTIEDQPTKEQLYLTGTGRGMTLFGLYQGIPQTRRMNYTAILPYRITIFSGPIMSAYGDDSEAVKRQVQDTVMHEIGHHFGLSDEEIRASGK